MFLSSSVSFHLSAEYHLRAKLLEADNYRMLNRMRNIHQKKTMVPIRQALSHLGRSLIGLGERLERVELPPAAQLID